MLPQFFDSVLQLIIKTSTDLPPDVRAAVKSARATEEAGSRSAQALTIVAQNIDQAAEGEGAICQDTGMPTFEIKTPVGANQIWMKQQIKAAVAEATRLGKLRPNSVDSLTGENSGNNLGPGTPILHFEQWERDEIEVKLILKGGGCENMNVQYSLPMELPHLGRADRTMDGVRKCLLHAVWQAQGKGCGPGAIGVCIGGDRTSGYVDAKQQLFRTLDDVNPDERLAALEAEIMADREHAGRRHDGLRRQGLADRLQGRRAEPPAGQLLRLGGVRLLGLPAPRRGARRARPAPSPSGSIAIRRCATVPMMDQAGFQRTGREIVLRAPLDEATVRSLKVGDVVIISGPAFTGRDAVHHHLMSHEPPVDLRGSVLYHCGPVVKKHDDGSWTVTAAGPTTSIREEPYQADIIGKYGIRAVMGKGGMGAEDPGRSEGARRGLPECHRRRGPVLRPVHQTGRRGVAARVRHAGSDVAPPAPGLPGHRDHGFAWQQPPQGGRSQLSRSFGETGLNPRSIC